jgi:LysM repeat protein
MDFTSKQNFPLQVLEETRKQRFHNNISSICFWRHNRQCAKPVPAKLVALLILPILLLLGALLIDLYQSNAYATSATINQNCSWYQIKPGDTLSSIAIHNNVTTQALAQANYLSNVNLIFAGKQLCLPQLGTKTCAFYSIQQNNAACAYSQSALQYSTPGQVATLLRQAAIRYGLPLGLLYAIAWQESGWNQHIISRDGGIGVMQIMPYTATSLNATVGTRFNPYSLQDNIALGALYLHILWISFHGNLPQIISAYNEGGWNVVHRGIFNQPYVNNVLALMRRYGW